MSDRITHTPDGLTDILCDEYKIKSSVENAALDIFRKYEYAMVQAPTFEYYDVYETASVTKNESMFKFFDSTGRMLVLRPDITTSVARMAATKLKDAPIPLKLCYIGSAFRNDDAFSAVRQREFTQVGIELIGENSSLADAEMIETSIAALLNTGLKNFQIDIGQIQFFKGLINQANISDEHAQNLQQCVESKDTVEICNILNNYDLNDELKEIFLNLPNYFGEIDIIEKLLKNDALNETSKSALINIEEVFNILEKRGFEKYISIDLSMVPNLDYYTGIIVKGFTHSIGFPICSGGRYDNLISKFGRNLPATGLAIGVERVMQALSNNELDSKVKPDSAEYLTIALAKGRLAEFSIDIFEKLGFDVAEMKTKTRKLIFEDAKNKLKFVMVKASDVPSYVEYGAADIGIVGKDTLLEEQKNLYEVLDLKFGKCFMAIAGPSHMKNHLNGRNIMRVASKYVNIAKNYFHVKKGQTVDIIRLNGSVELGPLIGLSEVIVDIVESGKTLKENGLEVLEKICDLSARVVVNRVSMKTKREKIISLTGKMKEFIDNNDE